MIILLERTFLEEEFAARIENEDVDGAMLEALTMNLASRELPDNFIAVIYNVENFVVHAVA
jgi:hypothetical protein